MFQIQDCRYMTNKGNIWPYTRSYTGGYKNGIKDIVETTDKTWNANCWLENSINVKFADW